MHLNLLFRFVVQVGGRIPVLSTLSELVSRARGIPVMLEPLTRLESLVCEVQAWKESAAKTFLLRNSSHSLLEVGVVIFKVTYRIRTRFCF